MVQSRGEVAGIGRAERVLGRPRQAQGPSQACAAERSREAEEAQRARGRVDRASDPRGDEPMRRRLGPDCRFDSWSIPRSRCSDHAPKSPHHSDTTPGALCRRTGRRPSSLSPSSTGGFTSWANTELTANDAKIVDARRTGAPASPTCAHGSQARCARYAATQGLRSLRYPVSAAPSADLQARLPFRALRRVRQGLRRLGVLRGVVGSLSVGVTRHGRTCSRRPLRYRAAARDRSRVQSARQAHHGKLPARHRWPRSGRAAVLPNTSPAALRQMRSHTDTTAVQRVGRRHTARSPSHPATRRRGSFHEELAPSALAPHRAQLAADQSATCSDRRQGQPRPRWPRSGNCSSAVERSHALFVDRHGRLHALATRRHSPITGPHRPSTARSCPWARSGSRPCSSETAGSRPCSR